MKNHFAILAAAFITQAFLQLYFIRAYRIGFDDGEMHYIKKRSLTENNVIKYPFKLQSGDTPKDAA